MSGIVFEPLVAAVEFDSIRAAAVLEGAMLDSSLGSALIARMRVGGQLEDYAEVFTPLTGRIELQGRLFEPDGDYLLGTINAFDGRLIEIDVGAPAYTLLVGVIDGVGFTAEGTAGYTHPLNVGLPRVKGLLIEPEGDYLFGTIETSGYLSEAPSPMINYAIIVQSPGYMFAYGAWVYEFLSDVSKVSDGARGQYRARVAEAAVLYVNEVIRLNIVRSVSDRINASDMLISATRAAISEGVALADSPQGFARALLRIYDAVSLQNPMATSASITAAIASGVVLAEAARDLLPSGVVEGMSLADTVVERIRAVERIVEALLLEELADSQVKVIAQVTDAVAHLDDAALRLWALTRVREGVAMAMRLRFGGDVYTGWVVNTATRAVSTYDNYPFNSFAVVGHTPYGATDDGLYVLEGDTDAGEPIKAAVRTVLTNLGTGRMKRVPDAYLGYTSTGMLVLKVVTMDPADGQRVEDWYKLTAQPAGTMREGRIKPGKGLSSVYWAFELVNTNGADFELDRLDLYPIILERRV